MELLQLKYFCRAAETENFSKTARFYMVPPSDVSQSIKRLEAELGFPLFDRSANRITLNENGAAFYQRVKESLKGLEIAVAELKKRNKQLKICAAVNRRIVMQAVEKFRLLHPDVELILQHREEEECDLRITATPYPGEIARELLSEELLLATASEGLPHSLAEHPFITMSKGHNLYDVTLQVCGALGFEPHIAIQSDDPFYIRRCVELGLGVAIVPSITWKGQFSKKVTLHKITDLRRSTYICHPRHQTLAALQFIQVLTEECEKEKKIP